MGLVCYATLRQKYQINPKTRNKYDIRMRKRVISDKITYECRFVCIFMVLLEKIEKKPY